VNLAELLSDGERVLIPRKHFQIAGSTAVGSSQIPSIFGSKMVNINSADEKALDGLPGVGPTTAKRIVEYREKAGRFSSIDELKEVQGISDKKFEKLKDSISVY
jgi:competence protein ComEA